jgi:hypothetical protein
MWAIKNKTPYAADGSWVQDKDANKFWMVVVKATFNILPDGEPQLAEDQELPLRSPQHYGEPGVSSLRYEADLLGLKRRTDVLINGTAYATGGRPVSCLDVRFALGGIDKRLRIFGERIWERGVLGVARLSSPQPFDVMPVRYERAFGGWDRHTEDPHEHRLELRNPVGTGFVRKENHCIGHSAPNVEYPNQLIGSWRDRPAPAGFGAIECHWSPRRELAGTYDERWRRERFPLWPSDFDAHYNNAAPADQQTVRFLRGGEQAELVNLTPAGHLVFRLPRIYPFFVTMFDRERVEHRGQLCTVLIEPDHPRVVLTWQTAVMCNHRVDELDVTMVTEKRWLQAGAP